MAKIVNSLAAKLAESRKENERLTRENAALSREVQLLRASKTCSPTTKPLQKNSSACPLKYHETRPQIKYDRPTRASAIRAAETCGAKRDTKTKRTEIRSGSGTYVYVDARPVKIDDHQYRHLPRYMQDTKASDARRLDWNRAWKSSSSSEWETSFADTNQSSPHDEEGEPTLPEDVVEAMATSPKPCLLSLFEIRSLLGEPRARILPDVEVRIPSKAGFDILTAGHCIAQEAFRDAAHKYWPIIWEQVKEGSFAVKLGRLEIQAYVGAVDLTLCGSDESAVLTTLYDLVPMRNQICHPEGTAFQCADYLDHFLEAVQKLTLALKDDERNVRTSLLRDELHQLAAESVDEVNLYFPLAALPFANETDPCWKPNHIAMFGDVLSLAASCSWRNMEGGCPDQCKGILRAAEAWALSNNPELLYNDVVL
ncbi:hypothetical protein Hte_002512 [Hypoxylon texense]